MSGGQAQAKSNRSKPSTRSESDPVVSETRENCMDLTPEVQISIKRRETQEFLQTDPRVHDPVRRGNTSRGTCIEDHRHGNTVKGSIREHDGGKQRKKVDMATPEQDGLISAFHENDKQAGNDTIGPESQFA